MHHIIKVKPVVMTINHIAEEEEGYLGTILGKKLQRQQTCFWPTCSAERSYM